MPQTTQKQMQKKGAVAKPVTDKTAQAPKASAMPAGLYLVATPIGNMRDITFRALDVLASVDLVACEDTRITGKLLNAFGLKKKMISYNDHSAARQRAPIVEAIANGQSVALVSDAGMPLISDPGYKLVRDLVSQGHKVTSLPGANAAMVAIQLSGLPSDMFAFGGFLPPKETARRKTLDAWKEFSGTLIFYETGPRLEACLRDIKKVMGERPVAIARELTKMFEEVKRGNVSTLLMEVARKGPPKGEIVLVIGQPDAGEAAAPVNLEEQILQALQSMSVRDAADFVAEASGKPKKTIYTLTLKLSGKS